MSVAEDLCYEALKQVTALHIVRNFRPNWLVNPKTGRNLEIDLWMSKAKIGIEVQGDHHIIDDYQRYKDDIKRQIFKEKGYCLIEVGVSEISPDALFWRLNKLIEAGHTKIKLRGLHNLVSRKRDKKEFFQNVRRYTKNSRALYGKFAFSPARFDRETQTPKDQRPYLLTKNGPVYL
jgi:hypothetical protein